MKHVTLLTWIILAGWVCAPAFAIDDYAAEATITFSGTSTMHDFKGQVSASPFVITVQPDEHDGFWCTAEIDVPVRKMKTGDDDRDDNMYEMFEDEKFPKIQGRIQKVLVSKDKPVPVNIRIRDVEQNVPVTVSNWKKTADELSFQIAFQLSLEKTKLEPPSFLGIINVGDRVDVTVQVSAKKKH